MYVGDYLSFDYRNKRIARSLAQFFEAAGVEYDILCEDELMDGNDVRRVGEEGLYEMRVDDNVAAISGSEYDEIVCTDLHAFNTFANECPKSRPAIGRPTTSPNTRRSWQNWSSAVDYRFLPAWTTSQHSTTHHLGRYNDVFEAPRDLVRATGCDLHEMPRNRSNSFCCGGGGGGLWMEFEDDPKPSEESLRKAVEDTAAGVTIGKFVVA